MIGSAIFPHLFRSMRRRLGQRIGFDHEADNVARPILRGKLPRGLSRKGISRKTCFDPGARFASMRQRFLTLR
jgi:hypothetical protein